MTELQKLYAERDTFIKYGRKVPAELAAQIQTIEQKLVKQNIVDVITPNLPNSVDTDAIETPITFAVSYLNGQLTATGISLDPDVMNHFTIVEDPQDQADPEDDLERTRSASIPFRVRFIDQNVEFGHHIAQQTFIDTLKHIGLERVAQLKHLTFSGYPLVGKQQRITSEGQIWQKQVDGWWIYVNLSNKTKMRTIQTIADELNLNIQIDNI